MASPDTITLFSAAFDKIEKIARIDNTGGNELASGYIYSGGSFAGDAPQKQIPAIYLTPGAAVDDWRDRAVAWLTAERAATFRFSELPKLEKLIMTEMGDEGAQRLTATRYGITSKIAALSIIPPNSGDTPPISAGAPSRRKKR